MKKLLRYINRTAQGLSNKETQFYKELNREVKIYRRWARKSEGCVQHHKYKPRETLEAIAS